MAQRRTLLPLLALLALAWAGYQAAFVASGAPAGLRGAVAGRAANAQASPRTLLSARGGDAAAAEANESVELGGFSGFVVGLALLPHVIYALTIAFNVTTGSAIFELGPFGMELTSCSVALGLTLWSLGSFVQRGRGLPAGPLGFLGLAEGLSYLAALGLLIATGATFFRSGGKAPELPKVGMPTMPAVSVPKFEAPKIEAPKFDAPNIKAPELPKFEKPDIKVPEFKAPDIKVPEFKAPAIKVPEIKVPDVKVPEIKVPEVKVPEIKVPEVKVPEIKAPEKKAEPKKEEPKKEEPKKEAPKPEAKKPAPKASGPDYDMLFD